MSSVVDAMIRDGVWCPFQDWHMGHAGEVVAAEYSVTWLDPTARRPWPHAPVNDDAAALVVLASATFGISRPQQWPPPL